MISAARLSIRVRLGGAFAVVLLMMAVLVAVGLNQVNRIAGIEERVMDVDWAKLEAARTIDTLTRSNVARLMSLFITTDAADISKTRERVDKNIRVVVEALDKLERMISSQRGRQLVGEVRRAREDYAKSFSQVSVLLDQGDHVQAAALMRSKTTPAIEHLQTTIRELVTYQSEIVQASRAESHRVVMFARSVMLGLGIAALVVSALLAWWIGRSITTPLARAVGFARAVAQGDLRQQIKAEGRDETAQMLHALSDMNGSLAGLMGQLRHDAESILASSHEIAQGSMELSGRTESQASSLEQTAASLEQLTGTVQQNAERAREASALVTTAADAARQGGEAVTRVIETMAAIEHSARQVVGITAIIDTIAFQTNLLALNAAVEAARAGEAGRGFSVVASEVRVLALRAATSANEIKQLVAESIRRVEIGGSQVEDAGRTIGRVVEQVSGIAGAMSEIALASVEQSSGIEQINSAVAQMDRVTQQNAALVEETAAAAATLAHQAQHLEQAAARFRLPPGIDAGRRPATPQPVMLPPAGTSAPIAVA
jgi:methyl-accepting chemotaxis protein